MVKPRFIAKIEKGCLVFNNLDAVSAYLRGFEGEELDVTIARRKKPRSLSQNSYYWVAVLPIISKETGHTTEELHEIFKRKFLQRKIIRYRDRDFPVPGSTTDLGTLEFSEYVERIKAEAAEMGIIVPAAGEYSN